MMIIAKAKLIAAAAAACIGIAGTVFWIGTSLTSNAAAPGTAPTTQRSPRAPERRDYAKLSPFTSVRWRDSVAEVQVNDTWYELVSIDAVPAQKIIDFAKITWSDIWQKRFEEDLVEVMTRMGAEPRLEVKLGLRTLDAGKQDVTLDDVPMSHENRQKIWQ